MVVVEHEPGALLIAVVEGERALGLNASVHVWDVIDADALGVRRVLARRGGPLVGSAVADPRGQAAVQVYGRTVLGVIHRAGIHAERTHARSHDRFIHRDEEVATSTRGQTVDELDAHGPVLGGDDLGSQVMELANGGIIGVDLPVAPDGGRGQVGVKLLGILAQLNHVVIAVGVSGLVGNAHRDVLSHTVSVSCSQARQAVDELPDAARERARRFTDDGGGTGPLSRRVDD